MKDRIWRGLCIGSSPQMLTLAFGFINHHQDQLVINITYGIKSVKLTWQTREIRAANWNLPSGFESKDWEEHEPQVAANGGYKGE
ncbi:hypothetical protein F2Q69_00018866 [Brassica cretica]|uniref:Uncharacterized protein n=1 Tax=Brassica cretica TaxID=69181 RepID=A0A8S9QJ24_BRACR|nr:hypothetical protein F2Q69_00018866 [Brassica cretica]